MAPALNIGMFIHIPPPDILGNAFLLILGFFCSQTTSRAIGRLNRAVESSWRIGITNSVRCRTPAVHHCLRLYRRHAELPPTCPVSRLL